jgi:MFS family permease
MAQQTVAATDTAEFLKQRRRAILSAWAGFGMDSYSIYITTTVLLPAMIYFEGEHFTASDKSILTGMTLAATLVGRPVGGLIFGHFADKLSRRTVGTITILGFGTMSLLIGCLPGAATIGVGAAITLLLLLRFIEGIFLGGEYTAATPLALEYAPAKHRGFIGSVIQCAASIGPFVVALLFTIVLDFAPDNNGLSSPYVQWGWRIPFYIGFVLSVGVALFIRRRVDDSKTWKEAAPERRGGRSPLLELLKGRTRRSFLQAWGLMMGIFFVSNVVGSVGSQFLLRNPGFTASELSHTTLITPFPGAAAYVLMGWASDYIGRKRAFYIAGVVNLLVVPACMIAIGEGHVHGWAQLTLLSVVTYVCLGLLFGILPSYVNEQFATSVRSSGWGVAYGTAVIIPAFYSYYMVWLGHVMSFVWTAGLLVVVGVVILLIATAFGPETRGIELDSIDADEEPVLPVSSQAG